MNENPSANGNGVPDHITVIVGNLYFHVVDEHDVKDFSARLRESILKDGLFQHYDPMLDKVSLVRVPEGAVVAIMPRTVFEQQQQAAISAQQQQQLLNPLGAQPRPRGRG